MVSIYHDYLFYRMVMLRVHNAVGAYGPVEKAEGLSSSYLYRCNPIRSPPILTYKYTGTATTVTTTFSTYSTARTTYYVGGWMAEQPRVSRRIQFKCTESAFTPAPSARDATGQHLSRLDYGLSSFALFSALLLGVSREERPGSTLGGSWWIIYPFLMNNGWTTK